MFILVCDSIIFVASWIVWFRLYPEQGWEGRALYSKVLVVVAVQLLSRVQLFVTPWTAARQASLSFTIFLAFAQTSVCLSWWCHQLTMSTWVYFWTLKFYSIDLCVFSHARATLSDDCRFLVSSKIRKYESSNLVLFQDCFGCFECLAGSPLFVWSRVPFSLRTPRHLY